MTSVSVWTFMISLRDRTPAPHQALLSCANAEIPSRQASITYNDVIDTDSCQLTLLHVCLIQQELSMWGQLQSSLHHMVIATLVWLQWALVELHPQQQSAMNNCASFNSHDLHA